MNIEEIKYGDIFILRIKSAKGTAAIVKCGAMYKCTDINVESNHVLLESDKNNNFMRWVNFENDEYFYIVSVNGRDFI